MQEWLFFFFFFPWKTKETKKALLQLRSLHERRISLTVFQFRIGLCCLEYAGARKRHHWMTFQLPHAPALSMFWQRLLISRYGSWKNRRERHERRSVPENTRKKTVYLFIVFSRIRGGTDGELLSFHTQAETELKTLLHSSSHIDRQMIDRNSEVAK